MQKRKNNVSAFSLVELIVVLVIIALLSAVLIVSLTVYIRKAKCETAIVDAREVVTAAQSSLVECYHSDDLNVDGTKTFQLMNADGSKGKKVKCGAVTNWMLTAAYYDLKLDSRYQGGFSNFERHFKICKCFGGCFDV